MLKHQTYVKDIVTPLPSLFRHNLNVFNLLLGIEDSEALA